MWINKFHKIVFFSSFCNYAYKNDNFQNYFTCVRENRFNFIQFRNNFQRNDSKRTEIPREDFACSNHLNFVEIVWTYINWPRRVELSSSSRIIDSNWIGFLTIRFEFWVEPSSEIKIENRVELKSRNREIEPENPIRLDLPRYQLLILNFWNRISNNNIKILNKFW